MEPTVGFIFRALAYDAGVQDDDIGFLGVLGRVVSEMLKGGGRAGPIRNIHLTTFCPNVIFHVRYYNKAQQFEA